MSKLTAKDFKNLTVSAYAEKLTQVDSLELLSELEQWEIQDKDRVGVKDAINQKQGELYDLAKPSPNLPDADADSPGEVVTGPGNPEDLSGDEQQDIIVGENAEGVTDAEVTEEKIDLSGDEQHDSSGEKGEEVEEGVPSPPVGDGLLSEGPTGESGTPGPKGVQYKTEEEVLQKKDEEEEEEETEVEDKIAKIRRLRLRLDRILQFSEGHFRIDEDVNDKLFKAKAWLGLLLGFEGTKNPYEVGKIENTTQIPPTAEKNEGTEFVIARQKFGLKNVLDAVLELRQDLSEISSDLNSIVVDGREASVCRTQAWVNVCEAKFELGRQLSKLRTN